MSLKNKKMKPPLAFLILTIILTHTTSTLAQQIIESNNLNNIEITHDEAKDLCKSVHDSRIPAKHTYMWTQVRSTDEAETQQTTLLAGCFRAKYVECKGEPRYPISDSCGFFTMVPEKTCSSTKTGRSRHSISTNDQQMTLSHRQAVQLCASIQNLPEETPFQIQYVPIPINLIPQNNPIHLSDECISWTQEPCADNEQQTRNGCRTWRVKIHSAEKCSFFPRFYNRFNSTQIAQLPNTMLHKTDFILSEGVEGDLLHGVHDVLSDSIQCTRNGLSVTCHITPIRKGGRWKRDATDFQVSRVKRACCDLFRCGPCGGGSLFREYCNCDRVDPDSCIYMGVCWDQVYPNGYCGDCARPG